ncbi:uncharacterized protein LACBIDRAFT_303134 [Laccaria bicolor S238N-H82]|uniref:Predicted protein n=1 Tax=Laccaria bicolor (strain S238N-H82 / ATCC MYA-4686) TaxID=486041 RepID=B0DJ02_LACBS|nr:uncharacterized protein LACBIDRAFT_303134 [Laccaria bicolor S238N-H82]EDR05323.1 predicted protein [Laccaria bicolor S238N-H82]|eukprot:XP_001883881.1 predicted protein [Laccaria bicolor S238N-H82]
MAGKSFVHVGTRASLHLSCHAQDIALCPSQIHFFFGLITCCLSGAMTPIFSFLLSRLLSKALAQGRVHHQSNPALVSQLSTVSSSVPSTS